MVQWFIGMLACHCGGLGIVSFLCTTDINKVVDNLDEALDRDNDGVDERMDNIELYF